MVTYYSLLKDYNIKLEDLTIREAENILESLVKQYYEAYDENNIEEMKRVDEEIDETMETLRKGKFTNLNGFLYNVFLHYSSSLLQVKLKRQQLNGTYRNLQTYISYLRRLEWDLYMLHVLLHLYFFSHGDDGVVSVWDYLDIEYDISKHVGDDVFHELHERYGINPVFMNQMDRIIKRVRDDILETQKIIEDEFYSPNDSQEMLDYNVSNVKNHIHEYIRDDFYSYQREKGLIDVQMGWINAMKIEHELNMRYKALKKEFNKIMRGNNGFSSIVHGFYDEFGGNSPSYKEFEKRYPKYNIKKSRYVPPDSREEDKLFDSYFRLKKER